MMANKQPTYQTNKNNKNSKDCINRSKILSLSKVTPQNIHSHFLFSNIWPYLEWNCIRILQQKEEPQLWPQQQTQAKTLFSHRSLLFIRPQSPLKQTVGSHPSQPSEVVAITLPLLPTQSLIPVEEEQEEEGGLPCFWVVMYRQISIRKEARGFCSDQQHSSEPH